MLGQSIFLLSEYSIISSTNMGAMKVLTLEQQLWDSVPYLKYDIVGDRKICIFVLSMQDRKERFWKIKVYSLTASKTALGPTQPPIQWVPGAVSLGVKRPGHEADHSLPSSAEVKECVELYLHSPNTPSWPGAQLKHRDNFTFTLLE
jgi:hypothetical protein